MILRLNYGSYYKLPKYTGTISSTIKFYLAVSELELQSLSSRYNTLLILSTRAQYQTLMCLFLQVAIAALSIRY